MIYILGKKSSQIYDETTPTRLAEEFNLRFRRGLRRTKFRRDDVLIRYGCTSFPVRDDSVGVIIFNKAIPIQESVNKLIQAAILTTSKVNTPQTYLGKDRLKQEYLPVLRRLTNHSRGRDIKFVNSMQNIPTGDFYTKYIKASREYRVLIFGKQALRIQLKHKDTEDKNAECLIRNTKNGYKFLNIFKHWTETEKAVIAEAIKAVTACKLDFGAVDVLVEKGTKVPYVLEVNTAPRLNKSGRELFMAALYEKLNVAFDLNEFEKIELNNRLSLPVKYVVHQDNDEEE